jgi:hypothetical protein
VYGPPEQQGQLPAWRNAPVQPPVWVAPRRAAPSKWWYAVGATLLVGGLLAIALLVRDLIAFPGQASRIGVPGEGRLTLNPGSYAIAYEHESVLDGQVVTAPADPGELLLNVTAAENDEPVPIRRPTGEVSYSAGGHVGRVIALFSIDTPGTYVIRSSYPTLSPDRAGPAAVLAVGPDRLGHIGLEIAGAAAGLFAGGLILLVTIIRQVVARRPARHW